MGTRGKGGQPSLVEKHPNFCEIELSIANGIPDTSLAKKYGISHDSICRHRRKMTPERRAILRYRRGDSPLDLHQLKESEAEMAVQRNIVMMAELFAVWRLCVNAEDWRGAASISGQYFKFAELQCRIVGEIIQGDRHLHLNVTDSPTYRRLIALIMAWAGDKPDLLTQLAQFFQDNDPEPAALKQLEAKPNGHDNFAV